MSKQKPRKSGKKQTSSTAKKPGATRTLQYNPAVRPDAVDVVGVLPGNVHVDPEITEGHPGYEESGNSELTQHL